MKNILLLLLLFTSNIYSQNVSSIKSLDTIFVSFKEDIYQVKTVFPKENGDFQKRWYTITLGNNYDRKFIRFYFQEFKNSEKRDKNIKSDIRIEKKTFFKKHKKQILGIDFFKNNDACTLRDIFYNKVVYVIDVEEKNKKKLVLYETTSSFSCDAIE